MGFWSSPLCWGGGMLLLACLVVGVSGGGATLSAAGPPGLTLVYVAGTGTETCRLRYRLSPTATRVDQGEHSLLIDYRRLLVHRLDHRAKSYHSYPFSDDRSHSSQGLLQALGSVAVRLAASPEERAGREGRRCELRFGAELLPHRLVKAPELIAYGQRFGEQSLCCWVDDGHPAFARVAGLLLERRAAFVDHPLLQRLDLLALAMHCSGIPLVLHLQAEKGVNEYLLEPAPALAEKGDGFSIPSDYQPLPPRPPR
ncbi:hypothetical protein [Desulfogranum mediterraneum]|uniref:hypothetical protein n=1 Tax=Desulfogranum mediterraneum TaxID=160661 RepID=UPI0003F6DB2B|nr:hypothetical protein [Desulfogranum mediterraneum]